LGTGWVSSCGQSGESRLGVFKYLGSSLVPSNGPFGLESRWVFSPRKLILFLKLIFSRMMLHTELGFVGFVRNVEQMNVNYA